MDAVVALVTDVNGVGCGAYVATTGLTWVTAN